MINLVFYISKETLNGSGMTLTGLSKPDINPKTIKRKDL